MANCGITSAEPFLSEISQVAGSGILQSKGKELILDAKPASIDIETSTSSEDADIFKDSVPLLRMKGSQNEIIHSPVSPKDPVDFYNMDPDQFVKEALEKYCQGKCWISRNLRSKQDFKPRNITPIHWFSYTLETFIEERKVTGKVGTFPKNSPIITCKKEQCPETQNSKIWSIPVERCPEYFSSHEMQEIDLPNTDTKIPCHKCQANGSVPCRSCNGEGFMSCRKCREKKKFVKRKTAECLECQASGIISCTFCQEGRKPCDVCDGNCYLRKWLALSVSWKSVSNSFETSLGNPGLTRVVQKEVSDARVILDREFPPDPDESSESLLAIEDLRVSEAALKMQREQLARQSESLKVVGFKEVLKVVPVFKLDFNNQRQPYYVYGFSKNVYTPNNSLRKVCSVS